MTHALLSVPLVIALGLAFAAAVGPVGWLGAAIVVVAFWYGRERRDAERHFGLDPFAWRSLLWWRLLWPGCWYDDAKGDFVGPALVCLATGTAGFLFSRLALV